MSLHRRCLFIAVLVITASIARQAVACPFCANLSPTLSEQVSQSDAVVLAQWVEASKPEGDKPGETVFEILRILKSQDGAPQRGERITLGRFRTGQQGNLFLLMGRGAKQLEWDIPLEVTETAYNYVAQTPPRETPPGKRLPYFLKFLEYPDELIASDAYFEFAAARYEDIAPLADQFPRDKLREWVFSDETRQTRLGLYGMMLGLCGDETDAKRMRAMVVQETDDFRLGIDGVIGGYLLLTGDAGLDVIDKAKLTDKAAPYSEIYAALQALRFMWTYGDGRIEPERLRQSMRLLLDSPGLTELVIADLARWKDWSIQDRLMEMYDAEYDDPRDAKAIRRAIVRYMVAGTKDKPKDAQADPPHVARANAHLETLRKKDPEIVRQAERFIFFP